MTVPSLDLTKLLPPQYRDKTLDTLLKGLFNRHLSKTDILPLFGHVGDNLNLQPGDVQIQESDLERQINQLSPIIYTEHGTEKLLSSWPDLIKKMILLGIDYQTLNEWFTSKSYNFVPPIDLDKFCNFNQYFWIGKWISTAPNLPYSELGIPDITYVTDAFASSNQTYTPEYYIIERGLVGNANEPLPPQPSMTTWSDWSLINLWVHRDDIISFLNVYGGTVNFGQLVQATRPLIEYSSKLKLNNYQTNLGVPAESGVQVILRKQRQDQLPLFDLYNYKGEHTGQTSAIFYYQESSEFPIDQQIHRRIVTDANNDYMFEHSLIKVNKELLFYKLYDPTIDPSNEYTLKTIWREGPDASINYSKYDTSGTLINQDKFINFKNYYWIGTDTTKPLPLYNPVGLPEYNVIEPGGTSNWSKYNYWVHVSQLKRSDLLKYVQATRPIIEFNIGLESQLSNVKTQLYQLPTFVLYRFNDLDNTYEPIPSLNAPNLNEGYTQYTLFARVADLPTASTILTSSEVLTTAFEYDGEYYIQDLYTGQFIEGKNGIVYGYHARQVEFKGEGNGLISEIVTDTACIPQILTLTANSTSSFAVSGSVSGTLFELTVGFPYNDIPGVKFLISNGSIPFVIGDTFTIELKSYVYDHTSLFLNLGGIYRTLTSPSSILTEKQNSIIVPANPTRLDGVWQIAPQIEWNVQNETRSVIGQGDLYFHLTSIMQAQPGLVGGAFGNNNWRNLLTKDFGLGGTIKQYDENTALLISILLQQGITPNSLLDFARIGYENLFSSIHNFVIEQIPDMLTNAEFTPPSSGDSIDPIVVERFKAYFASISPVVISSPTTVDNYISTPFYDSTSAIQNMVVTLPYIGLADPVVPGKKLDLELNMVMMVHHDGHHSKLPTVTDEILKKIVTKNFVRSPGQQTSGLISGVTYPSLPYKGQFWFKTSTGELFFYDVISDTGEQTSTKIGAYSYNRLLNTLTQFDGITWNNHSTLTDPWKLIKLDLIEANLMLAIEQELFDNCPPFTPRLNVPALQANTKYDTFQKQEFEKFGVTYGVTDVYGITYIPSNAFTWNYSGVTIQGASSPHATWQEIYRDVYGTPRPDLQPWISAGYLDEISFLIDYDIFASNPSGTTTSFTTSMWSDITDFMHFKLVSIGRPNFLSVDTSTGILLAPYSLDIEGLLHIPPSTASKKFEFGDLGPIELYWTRTLNYMYSEQKSYFRINPLVWIQETWGIKYETVGEYVLNSYLKNKESVSDFMLHGDLLNETPQLSWFTTTIISPPPTEINYSIVCVNRIDGYFKVTRSDQTTPSFITNFYSDEFITLTISPTIRGFFWGDGINLIITSTGDISQSLVYLKNLRAEGINQLYVQYARSFGDDLAVSINKSLFSSWTTKLGYRFGGFVNTDTLSISSNNIPTVNSSYNTYIKENKFYNSSWLDALRIQLVQRGSTERQLGYDVPKIGPNGTPGEDWIFRVDNFNPSHPEISWYQYNFNGGYQDFIALDGKRCIFSWKHYGEITSVLTYNSPFLITGIQNVLNFIFGYSDMRADEGWEFNNQDNPVIDPSTGRMVGYQLLAEQFIVQQFSNASAGSAFLFNPFARKVWYKTPRGIVANLFDMLGLEQETVPALYNSSHRQIPSTKVRAFRQDDITQIVFDEPAFTVHLLTSEYEHIVLFENYSADSLIYDSFLGQKTGDVFFQGEKQTVFSGRMDFGGHFLLGDQMKRNIESSVESILGLYETTSTLATPDEKQQARSLLGFQKKQHFADRGTSDQTEFRFWQGLISNKGTNFSIEAYLNSQRFKNAKLDEYWAYKIANYGDARPIIKAEMKAESEDCISEVTNYLFLEKDELELLSTYLSNGGYDIPNYDITPYDCFSLYTDIQAASMEYVEPRGTVIIKPNDETRWFSFFDMNELEYFTADVIAEYILVAENTEKLYTIYDSHGRPVKADCFEIVNPNFIHGDDSYDMMPFDTTGFDNASQERYYEYGDYIIGSTNPPLYSAPKFRRVNSSTIQILDSTLCGFPYKVIAYGPAISKYSPNILVNYQTNTTAADDIIWWDPARGSHHPAAYRTVDIEQSKDPAYYNISTFSYKNDNLQKQKIWGDEDVGKVWWNTANLDWQLYSDSKVYTDFHERFARWGALADFSEIQIYEWIKSSLSPQEFENDLTSDGQLAVKYTLNRERTWNQRVVAWKYSNNPAVLSRKFLAYQPSALKISVDSNGYGKIILRNGSLADLKILKGCKITAANYSSTTKTDTFLTSVYGQANIISDPSVIIGSTNGTDPYEGGAVFVQIPDVSLEISINSQVLSFSTDVCGQYQLTSQNSSGKFFITLTHVSSGRNQQIQVHDIPINSNTKDTYTFDQMGISITYSTTYNRGYGLPIDRISAISASIGNPAHDIYIRSYADVFCPISFGRTILDSNEDFTTSGWVAWADPAINPKNQEPAPFNKFEPVFGDWVDSGDLLSNLIDDIKIRIVDKWVGVDGTDWNPYKSVWGVWKNNLPEVREQVFNIMSTMDENQFFNTYFTMTDTKLSIKEIMARTDVFVNGIKIRSDRWALDSSGIYPVIRLDTKYINIGDKIRVQTRAYIPTADELKFNPAVSDPNPLVMVHWAYDYPHVYKEQRNILGGLTIKNYYYWVKNKSVPAEGKTVSIKQAANLLRSHDGTYSVPQIFKFYNQIDGRPNRYAMLSFKNLGQYVKIRDTYKLRLTRNPTLRDSDQNMSIKNTHNEWQLLRQYQPTRIPLVLWNLLTDTLAGETALGQSLPFEPLSNYDIRNGTNTRFGFIDQQQLLTDPIIAQATLKHTVLNTSVDKYVNGNFVIDYISYPGFNINEIDTYLLTPTNIRKFMNDLWRYAKPKQINEIFFAVLEDAAASNLELTDFFKTSFIALNDIRTIDTLGAETI